LGNLWLVCTKLVTVVAAVLICLLVKLTLAGDPAAFTVDVVLVAVVVFVVVVVVVVLVMFVTFVKL
jgi:hypothetical protein